MSANNITPIDPGPVQFQRFPPNKIIIIHPGSLHVQIGRASDLVPFKALHCIARRRRPGGKVYRDEFIPPSVPKTKELVEELEECRLQVSHTLQSGMTSTGARRYATPPQQIAAFNRRSKPEFVDDADARPDYDRLPDTIVGDAAQELEPDSPYNVHFPYKRGDLNVHAQIGGSLTSVLNDLAAIWSHIIATELRVPAEELVKYRCVLLVPDLYRRAHLKPLVSLLLRELGFGHCFLLQESVGATFGAGIGYACVVDVGDQKTAVACVEDGISHRGAGLRMDYGAGDVCQTLAWLLRKSAFPYRDWDESDARDVRLMRALYRDYCHIDLDVCGPRETCFVAGVPGRPVRKYTLQLGDEGIISAMALFHPDLLKITGPKSAAGQTAQPSDPEDPLDAEYLRETGRKREAADALNGPDAALETPAPGAPEEDIVVDALEPGAGETPAPAPSQALGLDAAVLQSIERCGGDELKRRMYSSVLLVGGGSKLPGLASWLRNRLALQMPFPYRCEQLEIVTSPKDIDPAATAWKGAAIMSCLESATELWVNQNEWKKFGLRILRERAPFMW